MFRISDYGRVAILDIDYHHGNGNQNIFYRRPDVLTVSIHGDPRFVYPHFAGFKTEKGKDQGMGFNFNYPLPEKITPAQYLDTLQQALKRLVVFRPSFLVLSLGLDTAKADPTGSWTLQAREFEKIGHAIGVLKLRTLVVQEGGYRTRTLSTNVRHFFQGLWQGHQGSKVRS
jgi:acetoin utilization deacetylase AcuC-like enzyme